MAEQVATISVSRCDDGVISVVITFGDGRLRRVGSGGWKTVSAAMDFAARLIAGELSRRAALSQVP